MTGKQIPLALDWAYKWEQAKADEVYLTQPLGNGQVKEYTWKEMMDEVRRMASYLKSLNLAPKSNIALLSKNCANWIMADLAIWMAGHVTVPLYPTLNADTVEYILEHSEAKLLFIGKLDDWDMMKAGVPNSIKAVSFSLSPKDVQASYPRWDEIVAGEKPFAENVTRDPEEMATIVYTSGSTGRPKGVMLSFYAMAAAANGVVSELKVDSSDRMLSYLPLSHVMERYTVEMASFQAAFKLYFADSLDTFVQDLNRAKPTLFIAVPRIWTKFQSGVVSKMPKKKMARLLKIPFVSGMVKKKVLTTLGLESVRFAASGSAPLGDEIMGWYRSLGLELLEGYGLSENFGYSHMTKPGRSKIGFVGETLPGVDCRIAEDGEIQVKTDSTMMGYFKAEDKTAEAFTDDGFLKTGDRGKIDELGRLQITGRTKEIFKTSKGKYVAPAPIENKLIGHPDIEMVCVAGAEYPQPHCMVMLSEDANKKRADDDFMASLTGSLESLIKEVNETLDPHEHLSFATVVDQEWTIENGFLTPTLKLKRNVVEDAYKANLDNWYGARQKVIIQ